MKQESESRLEEVIRELERRFGAGIVYRLSQARPKVGELSVPTGSLALDYATGIGGVPRGRITEILGTDSSGKTSLAYHIIANAQDKGGLAVLIDVEQSADAESMEHCGMNLNDLIVATPTSVEEALEMVEILVRCGALDALIVSSTSALFAMSCSAGVRYLPPCGGADAPGANACPPPPQWETNPSRKDPASERATGERSPRAVSGLISKGLDKINSFLRGSPTALVFTNCGNLRKDGGDKGCSLAPAWAIPSLPFYASLRIELVPISPILRSAGDVGGMRVRARIIKNKLSSALREAEMSFVENKGLDREAELFDLGSACGLIHKLSPGFAFLEERRLLGKGREKVIVELEQDRELAERLAQRIREVMR